ncbi:hypothetical protein J3R30DRAFT_3709634 [Lentinula aciculospora]|uniref:HBS1-like protein N-terminal domain-containing protein n=1 Tax=Lentinula aciculospora TaxID=153920 RepID=A0A9W9A1A3_9AGAR|nr:hypothetical protein J3R30DRAFT_3709634 [Lentinula aciculospora]
MSRHRYVKNLNIADELDDDALSDGVDEEEMTAEQQLKMNDVLEEIRNVIGEEEISGLPDSEIKETIWYYNFGISESIHWCLDQQEKRRAVQERQGLNKALPSPGNHYSGMQKYSADESDFGIGGRSRMPLIHLAQQQQQIMEQQQMLQAEPEQITIEEANEEDLVNQDDESTHRLSTISEHTERTELSPHWTRRGNLLPPRTVSTFTDSTYGNLIDGGYLINPARLPLDPNLIPVSPSGSAIHRLSTYEPAPSIASSGSYPRSSPPRSPSEPVPPLDTIPDIPDSQSSVVPPPPPSKPMKQSSPVKQTSSHVQQLSSSTPPFQSPVKQSKLAQLASSRASTRTKSSASLGTETTGSIKPYLAHRPDSHQPPSTISSSTSTSTSTALPVPPPGQRRFLGVSSSSLSGSTATPASSPLERRDHSRDNISSLPSSTSLDVRKALDAALELEALDRELATSRTRRKPLREKPTEPSQPHTPTRPAAPTPSKAAAGIPSSPSTPQSTRPPSKLALLTQAKAQNAEAHKAITKSLRAKPPPPNHLPPEHTEYLTPIANGSSVTTAITTSYQTLYSLTDPTRPQATEAPFVVPLTVPNYFEGAASSRSSNASASVTKPPSKLALKAKKAQEKNSVPSHSMVTDLELETIMVPSIFSPKSSRSSALPSAFASVLVDDDLINSSQVNAGASRRKSQGKQSVVASERTEVSVTPDMLHTYHKQRRIAPSLGTPTTASSFAFDGPSPDDIVFNARRGTTLAQRKDRKDISSPSSTTHRKSSTSKA